MSIISSTQTKIFDIFERNGIECYIVGGAVRNMLLGARVADYDFAVSCPPHETLQICVENDVKVIETGLAHGTVTLIENGQSFEMTSFRRDVKTDGRHAETEFGGSMLDDAKRRDFTINALYLDATGTIIDPLGGLDDLTNKRLRFVGNASERIREDYLRILRYYRFLAQYQLSTDYDDHAIITDLASGLNRISGERIGHEMRKIMSAPFAANALNLAQNSGVLARIAPNLNLEKLEKWLSYERDQNLLTDWRVRMCASHDDFPKAKWKLSNEEFDFATKLKKASATNHNPAILGHLTGYEIAHWALHLRANQRCKAVVQNANSEIARGMASNFPITGRDLMKIIPEGPELGALYKALKKIWLASDFALEKDALLNKASNIINEKPNDVL